MHHDRRRWFRLALCSGLAVLATTSAVRAEEPTVARQSSDIYDDAYTYVFTDDVMQAGAFTPADARVVVAARAARITLIRPRTAFVSELLKSVESL